MSKAIKALADENAALQAEVEQRCNEYNELTMRYAKAIACAESYRKALEAVESELMLDGHLAEIVQETLAAGEAQHHRKKPMDLETARDRTWP